MQIATELPVHYQNVLASLTDYDFCIGCTYRDNAEYAEFYRQQRKKGRFVILDNGAFEGKLLENDALLDAVRELHPQEVVAPDVIGSRKETFERAREFTHKVREDGVEVRIQVCPQGNNFQEWADSYGELADLPGVSALGISYVGHFEVPEDCDHFGPMASEETIRLRFFHFLVGTKKLRGDKAHHLLGLFSPAALHWYSQYSFVRGIDTSFPVACALHRAHMDRTTRKFSDKLDYNRTLTDEQLKLTIRNILWMKQECTT